MELTKKYRPKLFKQIVGQPEAVETLNRLLKADQVPHTTLFYGPSGVGKTTLARILAHKLGCRGKDLNEVNCADFRGIDTVRDIRSRLGHIPMMGKCRVWIIDEAGELGKPAQNAFLKVLEEPPNHVYLMLATTEPQKLLKTIRTRCTEIKTKSLNPIDMETLILSICKQEKEKINSDVKDKIIEVSDGSARKALVILHQIIGLKNKQKQLEIISSADVEKQAIEICRLLMSYNPQWKDVSALIQQVDEEPESIRRMVLGYAAAVALKGGLLDKAIKIIDCFSQNYYDTGKAGLVWSAYHCCQKAQNRKR
jgi:DNA polymerase-3 subunit gamma/tau